MPCKGRTKTPLHRLWRDIWTVFTVTHSGSPKNLVTLRTWCRKPGYAYGRMPKNINKAQSHSRPGCIGYCITLFVDQHRRQQRSVPEDTEVVRRDDVYDLYAQRQTKSQVDKLLWQLPDNQRAALLLFHQQGFSTREVAAILGLGERAAESLLARARRAFRQSYTEQIDDKE